MIEARVPNSLILKLGIDMANERRKADAILDDLLWDYCTKDWIIVNGKLVEKATGILFRGN